MNDHSDVAPMKIRLQSESKPIKVKLRRYTLEQRAFMNKYVKQLEKNEHTKLIKMPMTDWQAAPLLQYLQTQTAMQSLDFLLT